MNRFRLSSQFIILCILFISGCTKNQKPQDTSPYYECERKKPNIPEKYNQYLERTVNEFNEFLSITPKSEQIILYASFYPNDPIALEINTSELDSRIKLYNYELYTENGYREITDSVLIQKTELIKNTDRFKPMGFCQSGKKMGVFDGNFFMIVDSCDTDKQITIFNEFEYKEEQNQVYNNILNVMREVYKIK